MRRALELTVRFAAAAIEEAVQRRPGARDSEGGYSAAQEREGLLRGVLEAESLSPGLEDFGAADHLRLELDELTIDEPDDPVACVERVLRMSRAERDVFRIVLAATLDPGVAMLVAHLNDTLQNESLRVRRIAEILGDPVEVGLALREGASLRSESVVVSDPDGPPGALTIDDRILAFVLSGELPELRGDGVAARIEPLPERVPNREEIDRISGTPIVAINGAPGSGRRSAAAALAQTEERPLWVLEPQGEEINLVWVDIAIRDARLIGARLLYWGQPDVRAARRLAAAADVPLAIAGPERIRIPTSLLDRSTVVLDLALPSVEQRRELWSAVVEDPELAHGLARRFALSPGQIERASLQLDQHGPDEACRMLIDHRLDQLAVQTPINASWDRLVLPESGRLALRALCARARLQDRVAEEWGIGAGDTGGAGLKALLHGRPGTGKTLAAHVIASELGLPLYAVDVSRILSRWIGVAEQRISELFANARRAAAILFFDEADSLFKARSARADSATERHDNTIVNHLLQLVDAHPGVVLLATNMKSAIEPALMRRLHFVIEFPQPDVAAREALWRVSIPDRAPVASTVDISKLALVHDLAGGAITNAVSCAAHLAASESDVIGPQHIEQALRWEYDKLDRIAPAAVS